MNINNQQGRIGLIIGPMFSGKTTELLRRLNRYKIAGKKVVLLRPCKDDRDYLTHDAKISFDTNEVFLTNIDQVCIDYKKNIAVEKADVIGIDEGQFFEDLYLVEILWANRNKIVIISGLSSDSNQKGYSSILDMVSISETITKLNAVCEDCGSDHASFTVKKDKNSTKEIGGKDLYKAVCRSCLNK